MIKLSKLWMLPLVAIMVLIGCNKTKLVGSGATHPAADSSTAPSLNANNNDENPTTSTGGLTSNSNDPINSSGSSSNQSVIEADTTTETGEQVFQDCNKCFERAQQMTRTIGFEADASLAVNLGPYLVDPSLNVCDIHFFRNASVTIANHSGVDGVGADQVYIYCPCNCEWAPARDDVFGGPSVPTNFF